MIPSRQRPRTCSPGWWALLAGLGAVPQGAGLGQRGRGRAVAAAASRELTEATQAFRGDAGHQGRDRAGPADPEAKGLVERANGYLETSFLPGRTLHLPGGLQRPARRLAARWPTSGQRRVLGCAPADRIDADRAAMLALPPVAPATGWRAALRLPRDHYVRLDTNDYSVHPAAIGRRVEVVADLDRVTVLCDGRLVADHDRCWARHQTHHRPRPRRRRGRAAPPTTAAGRRRRGQAEVEQRCLADYDTAFGLGRRGRSRDGRQDHDQHQRAT